MQNARISVDGSRLPEHPNQNQYCTENMDPIEHANLIPELVVRVVTVESKENSDPVYICYNVGGLFTHVMTQINRNQTRTDPMTRGIFDNIAIEVIIRKFFDSYTNLPVNSEAWNNLDGYFAQLYPEDHRILHLEMEQEEYNERLLQIQNAHNFYIAKNNSINAFLSALQNEFAATNYLNITIPEEVDIVLQIYNSKEDLNNMLGLFIESDYEFNFNYDINRQIKEHLDFNLQLAYDENDFYTIYKIARSENNVGTFNYVLATAPLNTNQNKMIFDTAFIDKDRETIHRLIRFQHFHVDENSLALIRSWS